MADRRDAPFLGAADAYLAKRTLGDSGEPGPGPARAGGSTFVIQKHLADRAGLHWDLRLERGGTLWSWALPRGPSMDPADKRLAVRVEDHPVAYAEFEGRIPAGNYGAGRVEIWDRGTWAPEGDPEEGLAAGKITFSLSGSRLRGRYALVRLGGAPRGGLGEWLLVKGRDGHAAPGAGAAALEAFAGLTTPGRELWPGITKADLAAYWAAVAPRALPGLERRPLAVVRCPDGVAGQRFFQRNGRGRLPPGVRAGEAGGVAYLELEGVAGLVGMAQMAALELHPWGSTSADPLRPDRLVVDLDPGDGAPPGAASAAAREAGERLRLAGLEPFCCTTGGRGLHVVAALVPGAGWPEALALSRGLARSMAADSPGSFQDDPRLSRRRGLVLVDWMRNSLGATAVARYSPRAAAGAPVAMPLRWADVGPGLDPAAFTVRTVPGLAARGGDPWSGFAESARPLPGAGR